jgi:hypothetical protein
MAKLPPLGITPPFQVSNSLNWSSNYRSTYRTAYKCPNSDMAVKEVAEAKRIKLGVLKFASESHVIADDPLLRKCRAHKKLLKPLRVHQHPDLENTGLILESKRV